MRDIVTRLVVSLFVAPLFALALAAAASEGSAAVATCPQGTHWDAATQSCIQ